MTYDRYYYSVLTDAEKKVYRAIYSGLERFEARINLPYASADLWRVVEAVNLDNPHLFYVDFSECKIQKTPFNEAYMPFYYFSRKHTADLWGRVKDEVSAMVSGIYGDAYEKQLAIHDVLAKSLAYDERAKTDRSLAPYSSTVLGVFLHKKALCEGIAKAAKLLLNSLDIKSIVAIGKMHSDTSVNHAWNIVKIDGIATHLDITNDLDADNSGIIHHAYCNLTDEQIAKTHSLLYKYPECNVDRYDYFIKNGLCVKHKADLECIISRACSRGWRYAEFRLENSSIDENTVLQTAMRFLVAHANLRCVNLASYINHEHGVFTLQW